MQVKHQAFEMNPTPGVPLGRLLDHLKAAKVTKFTASGSPSRMLYAAPIDDTWDAGLIVTFKDQRMFCEAVEKDGAITFSVHEVVGEKKAVEFNHFVVNKETGRGVYQHYFGSCALGGATKMITPTHDVVRDALRRELSDSRPDLSSGRRERFLDETLPRRGYHFKMTHLPSPKELEDLLTKMKLARGIEYELASFDVPESGLKPIESLLRRRVHRVRFAPKTLVSQVADTILEFFRSADFEKATVECVNEFGDPETLNMIEQAANIGERKHFDAIAADLPNTTVDSTKIASSKIIRDLLKIASTGDGKALISSRAG
jgi:hypothetical protein